jgi:hypothetical protein
LNRHHHGGRLHLAGAAATHEQHLLEVRVEVLQAELAAETARADRLEAERDDARLRLARSQLERLLESEGFVDCDRPLPQTVSPMKADG